jgi:hypothetical protein
MVFSGFSQGFFSCISSYGAAKWLAPHCRLGNTRSITVQSGRLLDRHVHDALVHEALDLVPHRLPFATITFS